MSCPSCPPLVSNRLVILLVVVVFVLVIVLVEFNETGLPNAHGDLVDEGGREQAVLRDGRKQVKGDGLGLIAAFRRGRAEACGGVGE